MTAQPPPALPIEPPVSLATALTAIFEVADGAAPGRKRSDVAEVFARRSAQIANPTVWFLAGLGAATSGR